MVEASLRQARILIVDDEVANLSLLKSILERIGYPQVVGITDSRETVGRVEAFRPDLVVLDLNMPHLDGFEVMQLLRPLLPREIAPPILVLTGDASAQTMRRALAAGATDLLHKPFDPSEIFMRIRNLLQTRFLHLEAEHQNRLLEQRVGERTRELTATLAELKDTQRQVVQQERLHAFGEMAGGVVHDFNNALMSVIGYTELLMRDPEALDDKPTVLRYLQTMNTAGRDAAHVASRLRDFYRPREDGEVFVPINLNDLVEEVVPLTRPKWNDQALATGRAILMNVDLGKLPPVSGNPAELREVLTNLIFNAVDAMPEGGTITLRTWAEGGCALLAVRDTGTGMSEEVRARCLEPFFSTKGEHGSGLGLSMVFGILKRHEGALEIDSEPGQGTTLRLRLPSLIATFEPALTRGGERPLRSLRVLVVDDQPVARDIVSKYLIADGHQVVTAASGHEAVGKFKADAFDLLLTDQGMPGMTGIQLATIIKKTSATQPIILLTGFSDQALPNGEIPSGVDVVLRKPIPHGDLRQAVAELMQR